MGILLTVLSGFVAALFLPWLHRRQSAATGYVVAVLPAAMAVYLSTLIPRVAEGGAIHIAYPWVPGLDVQLSFLVDGLSLFFALLVSVVGVAIFVYTSAYIKDYGHAGRFYSYLLLFMASMLGLVLADNVFCLYVFFELTTIASFLLIGFKHREEESRSAAWQALLVTTMGGFALMAGLILLGEVTGSYELSELLGRGEEVKASELYLPILLLVLVGAFTKSAQFPFYFWLPNAMEAPAPVSAYLHSATMVKAGIYLLARFSPLLGETGAWIAIVTATGAITMLVAAYLALRYTALKKILAYSTIMALGALTMLLGLGGEKAVLGCLAFVLVHAFYKAPLFMVAGTLEHEAGSYDLDELGGLGRVLPFTFGAAVLAAVSMAGLPPFVGWVGKEAVMKAVTEAEVLPSVLSAAAVLANAAIFVVAGLVSIRPFLGPRRHPADEVHAAPTALWLGPLALAVGGLLFGLFPHSLSEHVIAPAVVVVAEESVSEHLALWHGFTTAFFLSLGTMGLGVGLYAIWGWLHRSAGLRVFATAFADGLDRAYHGAMKAVNVIAKTQTRLLQQGLLRHYVAACVGAGALLVGVTIVIQGDIDFPSIGADALVYEGILAAFLVFSAVAVIAVRRRFTAVLALSAVGFSVAAIFLVFGAPDVALVQLLIETLTLILVVLALIDMPEVYREPERNRWQYRNLAIAIGTGAAVSVLMLTILDMPFNEAVGDFFIEKSAEEAGGRNVVNNIIVDFRALDTLGEITVLVVAGLSAYALMKERENGSDPPSGDSHD